MANKELDATFSPLDEERISKSTNYKESGKAFVDCTRCLRRNQNRNFHFHLGLVNFDKGNYIQAANLFRIAQVLYAKSDSHFNNCGVSLYHLNRYDEAIIQFRKATEIHSLNKNGRALPYTNWSLVLYLQGKKTEAKKMLSANQRWISEAHSFLQERYKKLLGGLEKRLPKITSETERKQTEHLMQGVRWIVKLI